MQETIITTIVSGLIGWFTTYMYFKKSKNETDIQGKDIKDEFYNLNEKVNIIINSKDIPEKEKLNEISLELQSWIGKLNSDPGKIENDIEIKINELKKNNNRKSNLLRPYLNKVINNIDTIIILLNKNGENISWEKPTLPSNLYEVDISTNIKLNENIIENIKIFSIDDMVILQIKNNGLDNVKEKGNIIFSFRVIDNDKMELTISSKEALSFIESNYKINIDKVDEIYLQSLKNLFEYLVIKYKK